MSTTTSKWNRKWRKDQLQVMSRCSGWKAFLHFASSSTLLPAPNYGTRWLWLGMAGWFAMRPTGRLTNVHGSRRTFLISSAFCSGSHPHPFPPHLLTITELYLGVSRGWWWFRCRMYHNLCLGSETRNFIVVKLISQFICRCFSPAITSGLSSYYCDANCLVRPCAVFRLCRSRYGRRRQR